MKKASIALILLSCAACAPLPSHLSPAELAYRHKRYCVSLVGREDTLCGGTGQRAEGMAAFLPAGADAP